MISLLSNEMLHELYLKHSDTHSRNIVERISTWFGLSGSKYPLSKDMSFLIGLTWYLGGTQLFKIIRENESVAQEAGVQYLKIIAIFTPLIITNFIAIGGFLFSKDSRFFF